MGLGEKQNRVMISHANPADNDAAAWLALKLSQMGYDVWVDVEKLKGGETFWPTIEKVIRHESARFVLLLSESSNHSTGVLKELRVAQGVESTHGLEDFVIPCKLDQLAPKDINIELQGRLFIQFQTWAIGLAALDEKLSDVGVPKHPATTNSELIEQLLIPNDFGVTQKASTYDWNRVEIMSLPLLIYANDADAPNLDLQPVTSASFKGRKVAWGPLIGREKLFGKHEPHCMKTEDFLREGWPQLDIDAKSGRSVVTELLNKSFEQHLQTRGLEVYRGGRRNPIFYFNKTNFAKQKIKVRMPELSVASDKHLWGKHKEVFWHLGFEARALLVDKPYFILLPHVIMTTDAIDGVLDDDPKRNAKKMHRLRRKVAVSWWNSKWRGFLYAFLKWLESTSGEISIGVANNPIVVSAHLSRLTSPVHHTAVKGDVPPEAFEDASDEGDDD